jgi:hypothetical protein
VTADRAGELYERLQPGAGGPGEPGVEVLGRELGVVEVVEDAELFFEQKRAVERLVGLLDFAELCELVDRLFLWAFEQRPAGVFDPLALGRVGALVGVPLVAADLVDRPLGEVGSARGAVAASRLLRFRGPPAEPGVRVPPHRALHGHAGDHLAISPSRWSMAVAWLRKAT